MKPNRGLKWSANGIAKFGRHTQIYLWKSSGGIFQVEGIPVLLYAKTVSALKRKINAWCWAQAKAMLKDLGVR